MSGHGIQPTIISYCICITKSTLIFLFLSLFLYFRVLCMSSGGCFLPPSNCSIPVITHIIWICVDNILICSSAIIVGETNKGQSQSEQNDQSFFRSSMEEPSTIIYGTFPANAFRRGAGAFLRAFSNCFNAIRTDKQRIILHVPGLEVNAAIILTNSPSQFVSQLMYEHITNETVPWTKINLLNTVVLFAMPQRTRHAHCLLLNPERYK